MKKMIIAGAAVAAFALPATAQTVDPGTVIDAVRGIYDASRGINRYPAYPYNTVPYTVPYNNNYQYVPSYPTYNHYSLSSPVDVIFTNLTDGATVGSSFTVQGYTTPYNTVDLTVRGRGMRGSRLQTRTQADAAGNFAVNVNAGQVPFNSALKVKAQAMDSSGRRGPARNIDVVRR
jgi:hypothetical protein